MELALAAVVTPLLVAAGSLGARYWGPLVGGWLIAFPVTMGPLVFFVSATSGVEVGQRAAEGALAGNVSIAGFCLAYSWLARSGRSWLPCLAAGLAGFVLTSVSLLELVALPAALLFGLVVTALWVAYRMMPSPASGPVPQPSIPTDLPVRMAASAMVVLGVGMLIPILGSRAGGTLSMIPVTTSIVSIFAHRDDGPDAVFGIQRGLLVGLVGTAAFALVVSLSVEPLGLLAAFGSAIAAVFAVQAVSLLRIRRTGRLHSITSRDGPHDGRPLARRGASNHPRPHTRRSQSCRTRYDVP